MGFKIPLPSDDELSESVKRISENEKQRRIQERLELKEFLDLKFYFNTSFSKALLIASLFISIFVTDYRYVNSETSSINVLLTNIYYYLGNAAAIAFVFSACEGWFSSQIPTKTKPSEYDRTVFLNFSRKSLFIALLIIFFASCYVILGASGML